MPYIKVKHGTRQCIRCAREYLPTRAHQVYCRRKCKEHASRKRKKGQVIAKVYCECCGFIPIHVCQLDIDHIDGNHQNNERGNLQVLCANCHRLKTYLNRDWET
jgi:hypothetical protein